MKFVNYEEQSLPHVQVVLLFDVLDGAHRDMLFTEERPEHLAVEQTFTGTGYAAQNPSSLGFLFVLVDISQPVDESLKLFFAVSKNVENKLCDQRAVLVDCKCFAKR